MNEAKNRSGGPRIIALSAFSAFFAPFVFVGIIVPRKAERRLVGHTRHWTRRFRHEIARWS